MDIREIASLVATHNDEVDEAAVEMEQTLQMVSTSYSSLQNAIEALWKVDPDNLSQSIIACTSLIRSNMEILEKISPLVREFSLNCGAGVDVATNYIRRLSA